MRGLVESIWSFREWERAELPQQMPSLVGSLAAELSRFESYTCPLAGDQFVELLLGREAGGIVALISLQHGDFTNDHHIVAGVISHQRQSGAAVVTVPGRWRLVPAIRQKYTMESRLGVANIPCGVSKQ